MRSLALYLAFFLSGAAGLAYESTWTRYLGLLVGHDAYAQVVVLVIFLGGMSAGAALVARHTLRLANPLLGYAVIEAIIGVLALAFHDVFTWVSAVSYGSVFPALAGSSLVGPITWLIASLLILPQSILLGATFPLMSAGVIRLAPARPGRTLALLYFTNSLGGALGVLMAGFVLVRVAGLPGTLAAAGATNLLVALVAFLAARTASAREPIRPIAEPDAGAGARAGAVPRVLLVVAFGTAVASFAYEIDWIRMLSLVLGSATHSFELMLSAFILGLAIGALLIQRADRLTAPLATLGWVQVAMGVLAVLTLPVYVASFEWMATLMATFTPTDSGYTGFSLVRYGLCLAVMLPATICAGMTLPLITRALLAGPDGEAAIGKVYAWNTLGSIVGVGLAALVLLPALGLKSLLVVAGALDVALGLLVFTRLGRTRVAAVAGLGAAAVIGAVIVTVPLEQRLVVSGVFRAGADAMRRDDALLFYADGRTATVAVGEAADGSRWISTNGKPDASLGAWWRQACPVGTGQLRLAGDEGTQLLLPIIAQSFHPRATHAAVIGLGSGMSSHTMLAQPAVEEVATIEIEPAMVAGARSFLPTNRRVFDDPRSRLVLRDAKAHFAVSPQRWDLILSEPSNPWVSGVAGLFTEEFYTRVASALQDDGVFAQWLQAYQLDDALILTVLAAIDRVFPDWRVFQVSSGDLLVVATRRGALPPMAGDAVLQAPMLRDDLCRFTPLDGTGLAALALADAPLLRPVLALVGQPNSDFYPALDLGAERARFSMLSAGGLLSLGWDWFNLSHALLDRPAVTAVPGALPLADVTLLRESWARARLDSTAHHEDQVLQAPLAATRHWAALREAREAAPDWRGWLDAHRRAMEVRHAGIAGAIDSRFFDEADAAASRLGAGADVVAVLAFRRAAQGWDSEATLAAAETLRRSGAIDRLIDADELRDGAVVMALRSGNPALARTWYLGLASASRRATGDLRTLLLQGWLAAQGGDT
jgi:predicted membrane-bound spermidine synthase